MINPCGTMYNPVSVLRAVDAVAMNRKYTQGDLYYNDGTWISFDHSTEFSSSDSNEIIRMIRNSTEEAHLFISRARFLFVTFGTARVECRSYGAEVAELADALDSGSSPGNGVGVQLPPSAPTIRSPVPGSSLFFTRPRRQPQRVDSLIFDRCRSFPIPIPIPIPISISGGLEDSNSRSRREFGEDEARVRETAGATYRGEVRLQVRTALQRLVEETHRTDPLPGEVRRDARDQCGDLACEKEMVVVRDLGVGPEQAELPGEDGETTPRLPAHPVDEADARREVAPDGGHRGPRPVLDRRAVGAVERPGGRAGGRKGCFGPLGAH